MNSNRQNGEEDKKKWASAQIAMHQVKQNVCSLYYIPCGTFQCINNWRYFVLHFTIVCDSWHEMQFYIGGKKSEDAAALSNFPFFFLALHNIHSGTKKVLSSIFMHKMRFFGQTKTLCFMKAVCQSFNYTIPLILNYFLLTKTNIQQHSFLWKEKYFHFDVRFQIIQNNFFFFNNPIAPCNNKLLVSISYWR